MIKVIIASEMQTSSGVYEGTPYTSYYHDAGLDVGGVFPVQTRVRIDDPGQALENGAVYEVRPSAFVSNENGKVSVRLSFNSLGEKATAAKPKAVS
jgi:hypothetical protein